MLKRYLLIVVTLFLLFGDVRMSSAALYAVGPADTPAPPGNGFPLWYQDKSGLGLAPCLTINPIDPLANPYCVVLADAFFDAASPAVFPDNFPVEFFYWVADVHNKPGTGQPGLNAPAVKAIRFALEGSFANLPASPVDGMQTVFQRIRIRFTPPASGTFTVTHPFGVKSYVGAAGVEIRDTVDMPVGIPMNFITVLAGPIGPFLSWDSGLPVTDGVNNYIGDPLVPHTVTAGPNGNIVRIDGPSIGGPGINSVSTDLFLVAGMLYPGALPAPLVVDRSTYGLTAAAGQVEVFASAAPAGSVSFIDPALTAMTGDGSGRFFGLSEPSAVPLAVSTTALNPPNLPSTLTSDLLDVVTITRADYSLSGLTLSIEAASSDEVNPLTLRELNFGLLTLSPSLHVKGLTVGSVLAPPGFVTVDSTMGGVHTRAVRIMP